MTREQAKELLPIITAFAEGKVIEYRHKNRPVTVSRWVEHQDEFGFNVDTYIYRIKPEPREFIGALYSHNVGVGSKGKLFFSAREAVDAGFSEETLIKLIEVLPS